MNPLIILGGLAVLGFYLDEKASEADEERQALSEIEARRRQRLRKLKRAVLQKALDATEELISIVTRERMAAARARNAFQIGSEDFGQAQGLVDKLNRRLDTLCEKKKAIWRKLEAAGSRHRTSRTSR